MKDHSDPMEYGGVIIGIHGLANKPPVDEKTRWWKSAIAEGLTRNVGLAAPDFAFEFVYWADLRYEAPLPVDGNREPYRPHDGTGPLPSGDEAPATTANDVLAPNGGSVCLNSELGLDEWISCRVQAATGCGSLSK
jgi:hypothetical protein